MGNQFYAMVVVNTDPQIRQIRVATLGQAARKLNRAERYERSTV